MLVLDCLEEVLSLVGSDSSSIEGILISPVLSPDSEVLLFKQSLLIRQILDDPVQLLGLRVTDVSSLALLDFMLQVDDVLGTFSDR